MKDINIFLVSMFFFGSAVCHGQQTIATLEAESGQLTSPAVVKPLDESLVEGFSGGKYVGDNNPGSSIVFSDIEVPEKGTYEFKTYYTSAQHRSIAIKVNNYPEYHSTVSNPTENWDFPPVGEMSTYIFLDEGTNTIEITPHPDGEGGPNMDKFEIITTDYVLPEPGQFPLVLEAELADLFGDIKVKPLDGSTLTGLSAGKYIGDFHLAANSYLRFNNIEIPEEGTYELKIFSMGSSRPLTIKANHYQKMIIRTNDSPDWNNPPTAELSTHVYLDKGTNNLTLGVHEDDGPNLDKIEIHKTDVTIEKPPIDYLSFHYDHTDEAEIIAEHDNETLSYLTDNDELTLYSPGDVSFTSIVATCKQPILLSGFLLSAGNESDQDVSSWQLFASKDNSSWTEISADKTTDLNGAHLFEIDISPANAEATAARYYKLEVTGNDIEIGEWQLFGLPYMANSDGMNFPEDITAGIPVEENASGYPIGASGDTWSEEFYNVFDRKMSTKYYCHQSQQFYIEITLAQPSTLDYYTLTSAADFPDRDPKKWTLNAYNDNLGWVELDRQVDYEFPCRYATMKFDTNSDEAFTKFMIDVESNNGSADIQLLKWQLFGKELVSDVQKRALDESIMFVSGPNFIEIIQNKYSSLDYNIFDLNGVKVRQGKITNIRQTIPLEQGIFLISVYNENLIINRKIIIK